MSVRDEHICRLCLRVAKQEFEIDENTRQMLEILLLKLDLDITKNPIICQDCMEISKTCLNFKYTCISTEQFIFSYSADREQVKLDIRVIYEERERVQAVFDEGFDICRFCMIHLKRSNFTSLDHLMSESMFEMLSEYMAEMDLSIIENPLVCANCKENLESYFKFLLSCQDMEDKIKAYCKEMGTDITCQVKLRNVLLFMFTGVLKYPDKSSQTYKTEKEHTECLYPGAHTRLMKHEEVDIKDEEIIEINLDKIGDTFPHKEYNKETKSDIMCLNSEEHTIESLNTYQKNVKANILEHCSFDGGILELKSKEICDMRINKPVICNTVDFQSYISVDGNICPMYKCSLCSYEANKKGNLNRHMLVHMDVSEMKMYKCSLCTYKTKKKSYLKIHMLVHKDVSEIKMYKCPLCPYEGKQKSHLTTHMLIHKPISEIKMYKCSLCAFVTRHKKSLVTHMLVHKNVTDIKMYKCTLCPYEGKQKSHLTTHMLIHKPISEIKMYKCSLCALETRYKSSLVGHMLVHKDVKDIKMYKCLLCAYETKHKSSLNKHIKLHHDETSEIKMYKCPLCPYAYEGKQKSYLKKHMLFHEVRNRNDISEIKRYKCSLCPYEANKKSRLKTHMLVHQDVAETKIYKCSVCGYGAKHKSNFNRHMLVHKDVSEIKMYKCSLCAHETKRKGDLKRHMLVHKGVTQLQVFKCLLCTYEGKEKSSLERHILVHKDIL